MHAEDEPLVKELKKKQERTSERIFMSIMKETLNKNNCDQDDSLFNFSHSKPYEVCYV